MGQQVNVYRLLDLKRPNARLRTGTTEATGVVLGTSSENLVHLVAESNCTSGTSKIIYALMYANGAGGSANAIDGYCFVNAVLAGGLATGVHGTVNYSSVGNTQSTGGVGVRGTMHGLNASTSKCGSIYGGMSELYADGSSTDFGTCTNHAIHRFVIDGNATGKNTVDFALDFAVTPNGAGVYSNGVTNTTMVNSLTEAIKCKINGLTVYLPFATAIA